MTILTTREYDYRGRTFTITVALVPAGFQALVGEQSRGGWEWASDDVATTVEALMVATRTIRELVDHEEGTPF